MRIGAGLSGSLKDAPEAARLIEDRGYDFLTHRRKLPQPLPAHHPRRGTHQPRRPRHLHRPRLRPQPPWTPPTSPGTSSASPAAGSCSDSAARSGATSSDATTWTGPPPPAGCATTCWPCAPCGDNWQNGGRLDFKSDHFNFNLMPPFFKPRPNRPPRRARLPGRRQPAHAQGGRRGVRRRAATSLQHRQVHRGDRAPQPQARRRVGGTLARRRGSERRHSAGDRRERRGDRGGQAGHEGPHRLLRLHPRLRPRAERPRLERHRPEALPYVRGRPVVGDARRDNRRDAGDLRSHRRLRRDSGQDQAALRRLRRLHHVLDPSARPPATRSASAPWVNSLRAA